MSTAPAAKRSAADVIVIGLGVMGSATADALACRGHTVIGLEAHPRGHANGSSHGPTRIIRRGIEEGPAYVPLVLEAFDRWHDLQVESGRSIIDLNGAIRIAPGGSPLHAAFRASADAWGLPYETLDAATIVERFPGFAVPEGFEAVYEQDAGVLHAATAVDALQERALRHGATLRFGHPALAWTADDTGVTVGTADDTIRATSLVITAGAWTTRLVPELSLPLVAHRIVNVSFQPLTPELFDPAHLPAFIVSDGDSGIYGVPAVPGEGLKVGASGTPTDPDRVDRAVTEAEIAALRSVVDRFLPKASGPVASVLTCLYTVAPDGNFVIGLHPEHPRVVIASPCSGHGFKFASAIGPALADLATAGDTHLPIQAFGLDRFAADAVPSRAS